MAFRALIPGDLHRRRPGDPLARGPLPEHHLVRPRPAPRPLHDPRRRVPQHRRAACPCTDEVAGQWTVPATAQELLTPSPAGTTGWRRCCPRPRTTCCCLRPVLPPPRPGVDGRPGGPAGRRLPRHAALPGPGRLAGHGGRRRPGRGTRRGPAAATSRARWPLRRPARQARGHGPGRVAAEQGLLPPPDGPEQQARDAQARAASTASRTSRTTGCGAAAPLDDSADDGVVPLPVPPADAGSDAARVTSTRPEACE